MLIIFSTNLFFVQQQWKKVTNFHIQEAETMKYFCMRNDWNVYQNGLPIIFSINLLMSNQFS